MSRYMRLIGAGLLVACSLLVLAGCGNQPIAVVNGKKITRKEFLDRLEKESGRDALVAMVQRQLLDDAFTAAKLTIPEAKITEQINTLKERLGGAEGLNKALTAQGMTEQDLRDQIASNLKLEMLATKDVKVDDKALRAFFEQYKMQLDRPEMVNYSEIVVASEDVAKRVAASVAKPNANFADLAKQDSVSDTRDRGGKVSPLPWQAISPAEVAEALRTLKPGSVSAPITSQGRWYIVKLESITPAQKADFDRDRQKIEEMYKASQAKAGPELLQELLSKANVNIVDPKYADLNEKFKPKSALPQFGTGGAGAPAAGSNEAQPQGQQPAPQGR
ncbi:peptidyl-prolyl cis-trans isomerase [bacterium]|nr:peptidyl-prolyl cis-trans isomerase [bacterium]